MGNKIWRIESISQLPFFSHPASTSHHFHHHCLSSQLVSEVRSFRVRARRVRRCHVESLYEVLSKSLLLGGRKIRHYPETPITWPYCQHLLNHRPQLLRGSIESLPLINTRFDSVLSPLNNRSRRDHRVNKNIPPQWQPITVQVSKTIEEISVAALH